ncbi:hypothetical protein B0H34DRAFT_647411 [Crassisporium funariophilum]|nr:hypothetical protein B0H34DRAFT_647411 [Crassisporium funariophilum]
MGLLQWCILSPQGPSKLAAILFPVAVRVQSIRIFPTGAQPFSQSPGVVATTEPEAFFLDVFFNASPIHPNNQDARGAKNALVPTRIAYSGGQMEFVVDMGTEYATRLVIIQGEFDQLSMAIYGEIIADTPDIQSYEGRPLPALEPVPLSKAIDPSNSVDSTALAEQLLSLLADSPPLPLIIRLMLCLKPPDEDWEHEDFPYLYSDLDKEDEDFDLESLVQSSSRPIREDVSVQSLLNFASRINGFIGSKTSDEAYYVAKLLSISAAQNSLISRTLLKNLDFPSIFNEDTLDETTLLSLLDAAANIQISQHLAEDQAFIHSLEDIQSNPASEKTTLVAVKRLLSRLHSWEIFEDALSFPSGDFTGSAGFLKDIVSEEYSLGCWLECMINNDYLFAKLSGNPILEAPRAPPLLFEDGHSEIKHPDFISFVRALLGITSVLSVWAWADSIGNNACQERALAVLSLWQGIDGYREILNRCLLLRQPTRRLGWIITERGPPRKSGILAERLLVGLTKDPRAMMHDDLIKTILSLEPPFSSIEAEEMLEIGKLARVARDGLSSAVEELAYSSVRPFSLRRLRVLRVALAVLRREMEEDDGDWRILETFWNEREQGLLPRLVTILVDIADDLNQHFTVQPQPRMNQPLSDLLFRTADDVLHLITHFSQSYPLTSRDLRSLTTSVADLFACSDIATTTFSQDSAAYLAAQKVRGSCRTILCDSTGPDVHAEPGVLSAQIVLRTLLDHACHSSGRDPVYHILQIYNLIDHILPTAPDAVQVAEPSHWVSAVFPKVLYELESFCRLLQPETQFLFIKRLVQLDNGETGVGEWLLIEGMKQFATTLQNLAGNAQADEYRLVLQYQVSASVRFWELLVTSPVISTWAVSILSTNPDLSHSLNECLAAILDHSLSSLPLTHLVRKLAKHATEFSPEVRFTILLLVLRIAQTDPSVVDALDFVSGILHSLPNDAIGPEPLRNEVGPTLAAYADHASLITDNASEAILHILEWLSAQESPKMKTLAGISSEAFSRLCASITHTLPPPHQEKLALLQPQFTPDEDDLLGPATIELPESLSLSLSTVVALFSAQPFVPSTPKGSKTPDILGMVISPPTALLRSPAATGLTKTYANNDFRQLRQVPTARLNTSRLPSTHGEFAYLPCWGCCVGFVDVNDDWIGVVDVGINGRPGL